MKIIKQGITEIYDYTCEKIIEETCPVCKAVFEYTENDIRKEIIETSSMNNSCGHIIRAFIIRVVVMATF